MKHFHWRWPRTILDHRLANKNGLNADTPMICSKTLIFKIIPPSRGSWKTTSLPLLSLIWHIVGFSQVVRTEFENILLSIIIKIITICWIAGVVIEVWTPENRSRHYACRVWKFEFFVCPVTVPPPPNTSATLLWVWKEDDEKKLHPTLLHSVDPSNFLTRFITTIGSVEYHNADRVMPWTWWR